MTDVTLGQLRKRLKTIGTRHPRWRQGFQVRNRPLHIQSGYSVTAIDASGAEFGFGVVAGWPEMAERMANDLCTLLRELQLDVTETPGGAVRGWQ